MPNKSNQLISSRKRIFRKAFLNIIEEEAREIMLSIMVRPPLTFWERRLRRKSGIEQERISISTRTYIKPPKTENDVLAYIELLKDKDILIRMLTIETLAAVDSKYYRLVLKDLQQIAENDNNLWVREAARKTLKEITYRGGYYHLGELIRTSMDHSDRRHEIVEEYLIDLDSKDYERRLLAIWKLGELTSKDALPKLVRITNHYKSSKKKSDLTILMIVNSCLNSMRQHLGYKDVDSMIRVELPDYWKTERITKELSRLKSSRLKKRKLAIWMLDKLQVEEAIPNLFDLIEKERNAWARALAIHTIGNITKENKEHVITRLVDEYYTAKTALEHYAIVGALNKLSTEENPLNVDLDRVEIYRNKLLDELDRVIESEPRDTWWHRQKPIVRDLIKGVLGAILGAIIGGLVGWLFL